MTSRIVCGWYTPDYRQWAERLAASCATHGERADLVAVDKRHASWEAETQRKPLLVRDALKAHGDVDMIAFLDVDCVLREPLDAMQQWFTGDVALYGRSKIRTRQHLWFRSGTLLLRPQRAATLAFVDEWCRQAEVGGAGTVDQDSIILAMERSPATLFQMLPLRYCATVYDVDKGLIDHDDAVILHDSASTVGQVRKESRAAKKWRRLKAWLAERREGAP